jgi:SAM-dependent methyltransferase
VSAHTTPSEFDAYSDDYTAALERGIGLSGEGADFFARERIAWVEHRLAQSGAPSATLLDFGCGTGIATPYLLALSGARRVVGADVSLESLEVARRDHGSEHASFVSMDEPPAPGSIDVAYCNGVFHHIVPAERGQALRWVLEALSPGGLFAFFENNPWNPGTRLVMRRIPFDRDAQTLSPPVARRMLRAAGFEVLGTDFLFFFPRALSALRPLERRLVSLPLGAQYLLLARKPDLGPAGAGRP